MDSQQDRPWTPGRLNHAPNRTDTYTLRKLEIGVREGKVNDMKRKELLVIAAAAALVFGIIGCGKTETADNHADDSISSEHIESLRFKEEEDCADSEKNADTTSDKNDHSNTSGSSSNTNASDTDANESGTTSKKDTSTTEADSTRQGVNTTENASANRIGSTTEAANKNPSTSSVVTTTASQAAATTEAAVTQAATTTAQQTVPATETNKTETTARQTEATTQATTEATTAHQHNWVAIYKTVHHDEVGHTEQVLVEDPTEVENWETHTLCNGCGYDFTANGISYDMSCPNGCSAGWHGESVKVGTKIVIYHHYEDKYIVDQAAYDEQVLDHYECSCGATKN